MHKKDETIEDQEFENKTFEDTPPEPVIDTDNVADESFEESDTMSEECKQWQDKYLRLSAEFDNYRKRTLKEKMDLAAAGGEDVLKSVIGITDDFERALEAMEKHGSAENDIEGMKLIYQKFMDALRSKGVQPIEALGRPLNVDFHDAVAKTPTGDESKKGVVVDVIQQGFMLGDKVLRYAKVVVGE